MQRALKKIETKPLRGRARALLEQQQYRDAEQVYRRIIEIDPADNLAFSMLASMLPRQHRYEEALQRAEEAVRLRPKSSLGRHTLGRALCALERNEEALTQAQEAIGLDPTCLLYYRLPPVIYFDLEQYSQMLAATEQGLRIKADDPGLLRLRASAQAGLGLEDEAISAATAWLAEKPNEFLHNPSAGYVFLLLKKFQRAEACFRKAYELEPQRLAGRLWLGLTCFQLGDFAHAKPLLEQILSLNPFTRRAREAMERMQGADIKP